MSYHGDLEKECSDTGPPARSSTADATALANQDIGECPQASTTPGQPRVSQNSSSPQGSFQRAESIFDTIFGSCTGGFSAMAAYFVDRKGKHPQEHPETLSDILRRKTGGKKPPNLKKQPSLQNRTVDVPVILGSKEKTSHEGLELGTVRCDDSVSAISACTLDEMAQLQHSKASPPRSIREKPLPGSTFFQKRRSNTSHQSYRSSEQPSLSAATSGSSGGTDISSKKSATVVTSKEVFCASENARSKRSEEKAMEVMREHDIIMTELAEGEREI